MDTELKNIGLNKKYKITLPQLHEGQKEVAQSNARFKVLSAGRRWGKTRLGVWLCLEKAWKGGRAWWIAPTYAMALEGWKDLRNIGIEYGTLIKESEKTVIMPTGGSVSIRSADNPDRLRGAGLDFVVLDECAFMKPNVWAEVVRPTLTERQGGALFISTPKGFNWFEELYNKAESLDDWQRWQLPTKTNPFVPLSELDIAREEIGTYLYSQEYEAKFVEFTGGIFKEDWIKTYTKETIQFMNNTGYFENRIQYDLGTEKVFDIECQKFATVDLATSTKQTADYTVIACFAKTENNKLILIDLVRERLEGPDIVPKIKQKVNEHGLSYVGIERAGYQLSLIQIARREGLIVKELRPDKDKVSRALPLSAFMEGGSMFLNPTNMHYDDLKRELLQFPESEHDDMVDALAYGVLEIRNKNRYIAY